MKKILLTNFLTLLFACISIISFSQEKFIVAGSGWQQIAIIDKNTATIEWSYDLESGTECNSIRQTKNGDILFSYKKGAKLITKDKKVIWDFKVDEGEEVHSVSQLDNGKYFLGVCATPSRFITLNKKGKLVSEQNFNVGVDRPHGQFRQVTPTKNSLIIPVLGKGKVIEIDKKGNLVNDIEVGGNVFATKVMSDGNWLIGCGDSHKFVVVDPKSKTTVKSVQDSDVPEYHFNFVAETHQLKNGNFLFANWNGHSKDKTQPLILEIDKNNKAVWFLPHNEKIKNISALDFWNE